MRISDKDSFELGCFEQLQISNEKHVDRAGLYLASKEEESALEQKRHLSLYFLFRCTKNVDTSPLVIAILLLTYLFGY